MPIRETDYRITKNRKSKSSANKVKQHSVYKCILEASGSYNTYGSSNNNVVSLFDGSGDCRDQSQIRSAEEFLRCYKTFKTNILQQHVSPDDDTSQPESRISVCVIDTGIDKSHPGIKGRIRRGSIRECQSWIGGKADVNDEYGHGTHVVQLLLDASDNVDIYVAKIAKGAYIDRKDMVNIAAAINHAIAEWDVDIIIMSFGFSEMDPEVEEAINEAGRRGKLRFAAAANHGNNGVKTYPANYRNVICINASDGKGKDGRISPAATDGADKFYDFGHRRSPLLERG
ncbi:peptidase S8/S53 domain-containing protein [Jackrogersella minutella]|nr:peptidase S8/S53 domain-containing protein [Jackrogersella minutella]